MNKFYVGTIIPSRIYEDEKLTIYEKIILVRLLYLQDKFKVNGEKDFYFNQSEEARNGQIPERTFKRAIKGLKDKGYLKITSKGKIGKCSHYKIIDQPDWKVVYKGEVVKSDTAIQEQVNELDSVPVQDDIVKFKIGEEVELICNGSRGVVVGYDDDGLVMVKMNIGDREFSCESEELIAA